MNSKFLKNIIYKYNKKNSQKIIFGNYKQKVLFLYYNLYGIDYTFDAKSFNNPNSHTFLASRKCNYNEWEQLIQCHFWKFRNRSKYSKLKRNGLHRDHPRAFAISYGMLFRKSTNFNYGDWITCFFLVSRNLDNLSENQYLSRDR